MDTVAKPTSADASPVNVAKSSVTLFVVLTLVLLIVLWFVLITIEWYEINRNWPEYRCEPSITPLASYYGYNLEETMSFCMTESVNRNASGIINPLSEKIEAGLKTIGGVFEKANVIESGISSLLSGFDTFLSNFGNGLRMIRSRIRISIIRIRSLFDKLFGIFTSIILFGMSGLVFGANLMCNPITQFIGDINGVDLCCFAPETVIRRRDGTLAPIPSIRVGDVLEDESVVTSTFIFDGTCTDMVYIHGVHVSKNHRLLEGGRFIEAGEHPEALPAPCIPRIYCLCTSTNKIPVGDMIFTDYQECSDPSIIRESQKIAEELLGCPAYDSQDYSLGIDPMALVVTTKGVKSLSELQVGDTLETASVILGIVKEECRTCVRSPGGLKLSASQLVYRDGWYRAGALFPAIKGTYLLNHVFTSENTPIMIRGMQEELGIRDYMEFHSTAVQEPFDRSFST